VSFHENVSETDFLTAAQHVAGVLAAKFRFGPHDADDVRQMVFVFALEALPKFDPSRGKLEGYLYRNCRNRLSNARRDLLGCRTDAPCRVCYEAATGTGDGHPEGTVCEKAEQFKEWWSRRQTRAKLSSPLGMESAPEEARVSVSTVESDVAAKELRELIDVRLPLEFRADYLRMLADRCSVPLARRRVIQAEVAAILAGAGVELPEAFAEFVATDGIS
jgi:DNA-directed RNA polymerase specialized sigma24 family protein